MRRNVELAVCFLLLGIFVKVVGDNFHRSRPHRTLEFAELKRTGFEIYYVPSVYFAKNIHSIGDRVATNLSRAEKELQTKLRLPLKLYLYNSREEKGIHVEDIRVAHADPSSATLYCIVNKDFDGIREGREYELLLESRYGSPAKPEFGEYFSAALSGVWNQKTLDEWADFLGSRNLKPNLSLTFSDTERSRYWRIPWIAIFLRFVKDTLGWESFIQVYRTGAVPKIQQERWDQFIASRYKASLPPRFTFQPVFQRGISYAYSNSSDAGYATARSGQSLDELKKMGVKWIASIPYGFMRGDQSVKIRYAGSSAFTESDDSIVALAEEARARGMKVMLKPQIWVGHNSWTGRIDFQEQESWRQWHASYEEWILHYAILAELTNADLFCIGTELVQTTLKNPERWRQTIRKIREVYHGPLVYAANYGKEFEQLAFWDALDYIGLDNYYPIRSVEEADLATIRKSFLKQKATIAEIVRRYRKPLIFTEIGYMANENAGMGSDEYKGKDNDDELQRICYELAFETYWKEPWFYGMYWWKWFSDPSDGGKTADEHSPHGRPAQNVMQKWYSRSDR